MRPPAAPTPPPARPARAALVSTLLLIASAAPSLVWAESAQPTQTRFPPEFYLSHLPDSNPYLPVLRSLLSASPETQAALDAYFPSAKDSVSSGTLSPEQRALVAELNNALVRAAAAPAAVSNDWPLQPDPKAPEELFSGILPEISPLKHLAAIALQTADTLPADEAIPIYAAVAQMSRQQRQGLFLIQQLVGSRMEEDAIAAASRRWGELDPAALQQLSQAWSALIPIPDPRRALENERDVGFTYIVERFVRPALLELLGETPAGDADTTTSFTRDLRLNGLIAHGDGEVAVCLENTATKETFSVSSRHPAHDIRLERIDFDRHEAIIQRGPRQALIQLEAKTITEIGFVPTRGAVKSLDGLLGTFRDKPEAEKRRAEWLAKVRAHPGGIEGYLSDLTAANDAYYELAFASARSAKASESPPPSMPDNPVFRAITPSVGNFLRGQEAAHLHAAMFQAAIQHRLNESGASSAAPLPADPWSENREPFASDPLPGGAVRLRSRYETRDGQPVSFEFGAVPMPSSRPAAQAP